jgi:hypothetical protein
MQTSSQMMWTQYTTAVTIQRFGRWRTLTCWPDINDGNQNMFLTTRFWYVYHFMISMYNLTPFLSYNDVTCDSWSNGLSCNCDDHQCKHSMHSVPPAQNCPSANLFGAESASTISSQVNMLQLTCYCDELTNVHHKKADAGWVECFQPLLLLCPSGLFHVLSVASIGALCGETAMARLPMVRSLSLPPMTISGGAFSKTASLTLRIHQNCCSPSVLALSLWSLSAGP